MKTRIPRAIRRLLAASVLAGLISSPLSAARAPSREAAERAAAQDAAAQQLARDGGVIIGSAGPFVAPGTFRVQVARKLGRPDLALADGTWLYHNHRVTDSSAKGTLVVHFKDGRVSSLALVSPAVVDVVRADEHRPDSSKVAATK